MEIKYMQMVINATQFLRSSFNYSTYEYQPERDMDGTAHANLINIFQHETEWDFHYNICIANKKSEALFKVII